MWDGTCKHCGAVMNDVGPVNGGTLYKCQKCGAMVSVENDAVKQEWPPVWEIEHGVD